VRVWKLKWGLGKSLGSWVGHGRERRCEFTDGANGGQRQTAGFARVHARKENGGVL
jgi:hypothetical protein